MEQAPSIGAQHKAGTRGRHAQWRAGGGGHSGQDRAPDGGGQHILIMPTQSVASPTAGQDGGPDGAAPVFTLVAPYEPAGHQVQAIETLVANLDAGARWQVLLGVTGSGKTLTMAHTIARSGRPALVLSHNKTLSAQLYAEFKAFFPTHAVEYFVSYYDYYQPEAYVPQSDTYIAKDASINADLDRLRLRATASLLERRDVIIVATVSAIYGLGDPAVWRRQMLRLQRDQAIARDDVLRRLIDAQYRRSDVHLEPGTFRVRGDTVDVLPPYEEQAVRLEFWGSQIERLSMIDPLRGTLIAPIEGISLYPAKHFLTDRPQLTAAVAAIRAELEDRLRVLRAAGRLVEAQRLDERTRRDLEMLETTGSVQGVENYSRHLLGRPPGAAPPVLLDYFPPGFLTLIDESHVTWPQLGAMYEGDKSRKQTLIEYGFRLPSALDNRPLTGPEIDARLGAVICVSATPGPEDLRRATVPVVEQLVRPTGLLEPLVEIRPTTHQVDDVLGEIRTVVAAGDRVLITTMTKRSAEDLTAYLEAQQVRVRYLHADVDAIDRIGLVRGLRLGEFDVLIGINLLREGLDMPEVALVAILDADQEGFLRSERTLIQTIGRAARHLNGRAILYADRRTGSMDRALAEIERRRAIQVAWNTTHGITPHAIRRSAEDITRLTRVADARETGGSAAGPAGGRPPTGTAPRSPVLVEAEMEAAAARLDFELAARLRDELLDLQGAKPHADAAPPREGGAPGRGRRRHTGRASDRATKGPNLGATSPARPPAAPPSPADS